MYSEAAWWPTSQGGQIKYHQCEGSIFLTGLSENWLKPRVTLGTTSYRQTAFFFSFFSLSLSLWLSESQFQGVVAFINSSWNQKPMVKEINGHPSLSLSTKGSPAGCPCCRHMKRGIWVRSQCEHEACHCPSVWRDSLLALSSLQ